MESPDGYLDHMSYIHGVGSLFGNILHYPRDTYVHCPGSLSKPNVDRSSHEVAKPQVLANASVAAAPIAGGTALSTASALEGLPLFLQVLEYGVSFAAYCLKAMLQHCRM